MYRGGVGLVILYGVVVKCPIARPVEERTSPVPLFLVLPRKNVFPLVSPYFPGRACAWRATVPIISA